MMKIAIILFAVASVVFAAPGDYGIKTIKRNNVRLVCENGFCMLKPIEWTSSRETPIENDDPLMTMIPSEEDQKRDDGMDHTPEDPPENESTESTDVKIVEDGHVDQTINDDEIPIVVTTHEESMENSSTEETISESEHHHDSVEEHQDDMLKYMSMIANNLPSVPEHDISSEENVDEEEHTLSTELKPPHEENIWFAPSVEDRSSEEDGSVIYKIPLDTKTNVKGIKGVKTSYKL